MNKNIPTSFLSITSMHKFTGHNDYKSVDGCIQIEINNLYCYYEKQAGVYVLLMTSTKNLAEKEN